jgi:hypothetical protein
MTRSARLPIRRFLVGLALVASLVALVVGASYAEGTEAEEEADGYLIAGRLIDALDQPVEGAKITGQIPGASEPLMAPGHC